MTPLPHITQNKDGTWYMESEPAPDNGVVMLAVVWMSVSSEDKSALFVVSSDDVYRVIVNQVPEPPSSIFPGLTLAECETRFGFTLEKWMEFLSHWENVAGYLKPTDQPSILERMNDKIRLRFNGR